MEYLFVHNKPQHWRVEVEVEGIVSQVIPIITSDW